MLILTKKVLLTEQLEDEVIQTTDNYGNKIWKNKQRQYHNEDGPAIKHVEGHKYWYQNNRLHRTDGPAIEYADGTKEWWLNGKQYRPSAAYSLQRWSKKIVAQPLTQPLGGLYLKGWGGSSDPLATTKKKQKAPLTPLPEALQ